jgi:uncharacterized membrane protein
VSWLTRYRFREFLRTNFWLLPACALISALLVARSLRWVDEHTHWEVLGLTPEGAKGVLSALVSSMLTFVVVVASSLLLVVQLVSASLTPRIIAPAFHHPLIRLALSLFIFTYALSMAVLGRISDQVPELAVAVTLGLNILSVIVFMYFVGALGMGLRPIELMVRTAKQGRDVINEIYPMQCDGSEDQDQLSATIDRGPVKSEVQHQGSTRVVVAFDALGLFALARKHRAVIELVPRVGDPIAVGEPLFRVYGADSIRHEELRQMVALGAERTLQQDPRLAFRIILDIACKALSPAINDPTTAVLAIDQVHRLLRLVGSRKLLSGSQVDSNGEVRLVFSTPSWEDFVWLGTAEFRHYGADSIRVCQRLRAMLQHLIQTLPPARGPALEKQLRLLDQAVERRFSEPEDRERICAGALSRTGASTDA